MTQRTAHRPKSTVHRCSSYYDISGWQLAMRVAIVCALTGPATIRLRAVLADQEHTATQSEKREKTLAVFEAISLVKKKPKVLTLDDLTDLSPEVAAELAKHVGPLSLNGLGDLSEQTAAALAKHRGYLYLGGLNKISDDVAAALARHQSLIHLSGVKSISEQQARALLRHKGWLYLNGLETCDDATLDVLRSKKLILLPQKFR